MISYFFYIIIFSDNGVLLSCGFNGYGQLCHGDTKNRDYLEVVHQLAVQGHKVKSVHCSHWNTVIITDLDQIKLFNKKSEKYVCALFLLIICACI